MKLFFLGVPGAGKGTQAEIISAKLGIPAISTGAIIREAVEKQTQMGIKAEAHMKDGTLVPDEVVIGIIKERLAQKDCAKGFILDGFPRTLPQGRALLEMGVEADHVIVIEVPDEIIEERMMGRRVCPKCAATYHTRFQPPRDGKNCDSCDVKLTIRNDDEPKTVRNRLAIYHEQTEPLKGFYEDLGKCVVLDGTQEIETVTAQILRIIGK